MKVQIRKENCMNIGILGLGSMGKTHLYCVNNLKYFFDGAPYVEITSVCTKNIVNAKKASEQFGIPNYSIQWCI